MCIKYTKQWFLWESDIMEFKKISETKFQCLLLEEDLEENNISLDDFFRNDTQKIHSLLDVVMEQAHETLGVQLQGGVVSLQLSPQPNRSLLLTVCSGQEDITDIIKDAGQRAVQMMEDYKAAKGNGNIIKKDDAENKDFVKAAPFKSMEEESSEGGILAVDNQGNVVGCDGAICAFDSLSDVEEFCQHSLKTWGMKNSLYKDPVYNDFYLVLERGRSSEKRYKQFVNNMMDYGELIGFSMDRIMYMKEHFEICIEGNAVNIIKKYCEA